MKKYIFMWIILITGSIFLFMKAPKPNNEYIKIPYTMYIQEKENLIKFWYYCYFIDEQAICIK